MVSVRLCWKGRPNSKVGWGIFAFSLIRNCQSRSCSWLPLSSWSPAPTHTLAFLVRTAAQAIAALWGEQGKSRGCLPSSSCSAGCHSPGKQTSEHSLLSSAFTLAMSKSLLLSHSVPRNAHVLWPVMELTQLDKGWLCFLYFAVLKIKVLRMETKRKIKSCVKKKTINRVNKEWTKEPSCVGMSGYSHRPGRFPPALF